jgi:predicted phage tail protein
VQWVTCPEEARAIHVTVGALLNPRAVKTTTCPLFVFKLHSSGPALRAQARPRRVGPGLHISAGDGAYGENANGEVRLHGALAAQFGRVFHFDIQTPREAVDAIECARRGFKAAIMKLDAAGMVFRVRSKTHDYDNDDVGSHLGSASRIDIIPIVRGASAGVRFVVGAILTAVGFMLSGTPFAPLGPPMMSLGISLMLGAVTEWLTPTPKREEYKALDSWTISGPTNTTEQGVPVPIIYGEVLTGSVPISAGLAASDLSPSGALTPFVTIGGQRDVYFWLNSYTGVATVVLQFGVSPFNMAEPYTYSWSHGGFPNATAVRMSGANTASVRIEVDYSVIPGVSAGDAATVAVTVTGKDNPTEGNTVNANATINVTAGANSAVYDGGS